MTDTNHIEVLRAVRSVFDHIPQPCAERDALDAAITTLSARASAEDAGDFASDTAALAFLRLVGNGNPNIERAVKRLHSSLIARASAGEGGEGWACVELSVIPNAAAETGARMIALARQMGWNDESTANLIYTEMLLQASRYYASDTAAPQPAQAGASGGGDERVRAALEYLASIPGTEPYLRPIREALTTPASPATGEGGLHFTDATIDKLQDVMAGHGFAVPVRVISDAFRAAMLAAAPQPQAVDCGEAGHEEGRCGNAQCLASATPPAHGDGEVDKSEMADSDRLNSGKPVSPREIDKNQAHDLALSPTPEAQEARDAARYRWLRNNSVGQWEHPIVVSQRRAAFDTMQYIGPLAGASLDAAIDAALALPAQGEG